MPFYEFKCPKCKKKIEVLQAYGADFPECCEGTMDKLVSLPCDFTKGTNRSPRRRWMRDWTPDSPKFSTGSHHGEKY